MDYSELNPLDRKKTLISLLLKMAAVDGEVDKNEYIFIVGAAKKMGLEEPDVFLIRNNVDDFDTVIPADEKERIKCFFYVITTMRLDWNISDKEKELARQIGLILGLNTLMVLDLIHAIATQMDPDTPDANIDSILTRYLN